jgi:flagellar M-ring protein FliF
VSNLAQTFFKAGPTRIYAALGVTALVAAALFALMFRMSQEEKALLFSGVSLQEAGEIPAKLEGAGIQFDLRGDGGDIFVPRSKVLEARMMLSADGLPSRGSVGYEIFDRQDALGATQFQQNINRLRALEGELARTIVALDGVEGARVHLVLPERQLFERERQQPSASIVLDARDVTAGQVRAIRNLVASAVPGLKPSAVTLLDEGGKLLAAGDGDDFAAAAEGVDSRQAALESRIRETVRDIVESVVGPGGARVQVAAEMDFNRVESRSQTFDPEGRVARSTQSTEETNNAQERDAQGGATAGRNVPDGAGQDDDARSSTVSSRTQELTNFEISNTTKTEISEGGRVKKLSVAVAVDGVTTPGAEGQPAQWTPRDQAELDRITALVKSAVGFDEARGDKVEVVNVRFAATAMQGVEAKEPGLLDFQRSDIMRGVELLVTLIAALALVFFVLRPLVSGILKPQQQLVAVSPAGAIVGPQSEAVAAVAGGAAAALPAPGTPDAIGLDISRISGQVNASAVKRVAEVIEQHPDESVAIIRGWLNNAA